MYIDNIGYYDCYFKGGMITLIKSLENEIKKHGGKIETNVEIKSIDHNKIKKKSAIRTRGDREDGSSGSQQSAHQPAIGRERANFDRGPRGGRRQRRAAGDRGGRTGDRAARQRPGPRVGGLPRQDRIDAGG